MKQACLWSLVLCMVPLSIPAQEASLKEYADYLFAEGEYYRALSEYKRILFFAAGSAIDSAHCLVQIARCYYRGGEYDNCISFAGSGRFGSTDRMIRRDLNRYAGLSSLKLKATPLAISYFNESNDNSSQLLAGIAYLCEFDWRTASEVFTRLSDAEDAGIAVPARELVSLSQEANRLKMKSPAIAGILAIIPGCGYLYAGLRETAWSSFVLNALLLGSAYELRKEGLPFAGASLFAIGLGWYTGNIYGSVAAALRYNRSKREDFIERGLDRYKYLIE